MAILRSRGRRDRRNAVGDASREAREYAAKPLPAQTARRTTPETLIALDFRGLSVHDPVHATNGGRLIKGPRISRFLLQGRERNRPRRHSRCRGLGGSGTGILWVRGERAAPGPQLSGRPPSPRVAGQCPAGHGQHARGQGGRRDPRPDPRVRRPCRLTVLRCVTSLRASLATAWSVRPLSFRGGDIQMIAAGVAALPAVARVRCCTSLLCVARRRPSFEGCASFPAVSSTAPWPGLRGSAAR